MIYQSEAIELVMSELRAARTKHVIFARAPIDGLAVIAEELGELIADVQADRLAAARTEAAHVAVTAIRMIELIDWTLAMR